jgi:flagellar assembly factor FliW
MATTIDSTRFGRIEIRDEAVIEFPTGLIGRPGTRVSLVAREEDDVFLWLHSIDHPELALPVTNPWTFFPEYEVELSDAEAERIGVTDPTQADVYVTVRAIGPPEDFTANLRAPVLVSAGRGHQVINEAADAPVRAALFAPVPKVEAEPVA